MEQEETESAISFTFDKHLVDVSDIISCAMEQTEVKDVNINKDLMAIIFYMQIFKATLNKA